MLWFPVYCSWCIENSLRSWKISLWRVILTLSMIIKLCRRKTSACPWPLLGIHGYSFSFENSSSKHFNCILIAVTFPLRFQFLAKSLQGFNVELKCTLSQLVSLIKEIVVWDYGLNFVQNTPLPSIWQAGCSWRVKTLSSYILTQPLQAEIQELQECKADAVVAFNCFIEAVILATTSAQ